MREWLLAGLVTVGAVAGASCGDSSPTAPGNGGGSSTLTIVPATDFLTIGTAVTLQARLAESGATPRVVCGVWSSDDGRVAAVDRQGRVSALGSGTTTIRATFEGQVATQSLRVTPDFGGTWNGPRRVLSCVHPTPTVCTTSYPNGSQFATRLVLTQVKERVSGTLIFTPPSGPQTATLAGEISPTGQLSLVGTISTSGSGGSISLIGSVQDWRTEIHAVQGVLLGSFTEQRLETNGTAWRVSWEVFGLARTVP
jgi:hypothetical protein